MKSYQFKDLSVTLETTQFNRNYCLIPSYYCAYSFTNCGVFTNCFGCTIQITHCPFNTVLGCAPISCGISEIDTWKSPIIYEVDKLQENELARFKQELSSLQTYVDQKLKRSPEELEQLEKKLYEAINEVRAQREQASEE